MEIIDKINKIAVIIAIENYRNSENSGGFSSVNYARNDAIAIKEVLINDFGLSKDQVYIWLDNDASKTVIENELPFIIRGLTSTDVFYFYYAGHGFFQNGENRLTAWDSQPFNLSGTSISLNDILLEPLKKSECTKSLIFIDACSSNLSGDFMARDMISDMKYDEFEKFVNSSNYQAIFLSCSPGEKAYPSSILKHGIWTWHLVEALKGKATESIERDDTITDRSLKDYLRKSVPEFITKKTEIRQSQTPWARISSSNTFQIRKIPEKQILGSNSLNLALDYNGIFLRKLITKNVSNIKGFNKKKGHFIPQTNNAQSTIFIQKLLAEDIAEELNTIYDNIKSILNLRRKDIEKNIELEGGTIDTEYFRFSIIAEQNPEDCSEVVITRQLVLRKTLDVYPSNFHDIFPVKVNEVVIPIKGEMDFDELVEMFEELEEQQGGKLNENDNNGIIEYSTEDGFIIIIQTYSSELVIHPHFNKNCLKLLEDAKSGLIRISGSMVKLLEE
jgi:hypothetical protein